MDNTKAMIKQTKATIKQQCHAQGREMLAKLLPEGSTIFHSFNCPPCCRSYRGYASRRKFYAVADARILDITRSVCTFLDIRRDQYGHALTRQTSQEIVTEIGEKLERELKFATI